MDLTAYPQTELLYVGFNQDYGCFACGTENGFFVFDTNPLKSRFRREFDDGGIGVVAMLYRSNIIALVGGGKNPKFSKKKNKVMIWDDYQRKCIAELEFRSWVKGVKLRRDRIAVALEKKVYIYNMDDLSLLDQIDTFENPKGLLALSAQQESIVLVTLGNKIGEVRISVYNTSQTHILPAHTNAITQLTLSLDGKLLATSSDRGTLIRIWDTSTGQQLKELRRGAQTAEIQSIAFSEKSNLLCVTSDKGTVHLYNMGQVNRQSSLSFFRGVLPYLGSEWSVAQFSVPEPQSICAFQGDNNVIVLGSTGNCYTYKFEMSKEKGGTGHCEQISIARFLPKRD
mmetsp:Transcript_25635/g.28516  ORF Transcript_25635/g.28516 Transcript_25635/m.28516 type:complete len:341 (+) Transcript_25635:20-1042(+)